MLPSAHEQNGNDGDKHLPETDCICLHNYTVNIVCEWSWSEYQVVGGVAAENTDKYPCGISEPVVVRLV